MYNLTQENRQRIESLEQAQAEGVRRLTVTDTKAQLDEFPLPPNAEQGDTAVVRNDETHGGYTTEYELDEGLRWQFLFVIDTVTPQATNSSLGTVMGADADGKVFVELDGTMSVVGWDKMNSSIPKNVSQLNNDAGYITNDDIEIPEASSTIKGISTLGSADGAARYGEKTDVGLSNVDNTSDENKPLSAAARTALADKEDALVEGPNITLDRTSQPGKTIISASGGEGTGDVPDATATVKGKATLGSEGGSARYGYKADVGLENVDNTSDMAKPISTKQQEALNEKAKASDVVHNTGDETIAGTKTFTGMIISKSGLVIRPLNGGGNFGAPGLEFGTGYFRLLYSSTAPTAPDHVTNKRYVDAEVQKAKDYVDELEEADPVFGEWKSQTFNEANKINPANLPDGIGHQGKIVLAMTRAEYEADPRRNDANYVFCILKQA